MGPLRTSKFAIFSALYRQRRIQCRRDYGWMESQEPPQTWGLVFKFHNFASSLGPNRSMIDRIFSTAKGRTTGGSIRCVHSHASPRLQTTSAGPAASAQFQNSDVGPPTSCDSGLSDLDCQSPVRGSRTVTSGPRHELTRCTLHLIPQRSRSSAANGKRSTRSARRRVDGDEVRSSASTAGLGRGSYFLAAS